MAPATSQIAETSIGSTAPETASPAAKTMLLNNIIQLKKNMPKATETDRNQWGYTQ
jgi:hypothetical protein